MANSFQRVNRSLDGDNGIRTTLLLFTALVLLGAWIVWAFGSEVTRYESSESARLEVDSAAYPIQAGVSGRLVSNSLTLGKEVHAGDVVAELDSNSERLSLEEERASLAALRPQLDTLRLQMQTEANGEADERRVLGISIDGARAQYREAETQAVLAEQEAQRASRLRAEGILAEADAQRAIAEAQSKRAAAESLRVAASRLEPELRVRERDRQVRVTQVSEEIAKLEAEATTSSAAIKRLEYDVERCRIRAPVSGRLGDCAPLRPGAHISEGEQLGVILPSGKLRVIAEFEPSAALGKVRAGQAAILRLDGFPWAQYGTVPARVSGVAEEIRDGKVRVELAVNPRHRARIPFQHGLPGSVQIEVERISPAALVLRSAGELAGAR